MKRTCHSGGCPGADMAWEIAGYDYDVITIGYSFHNHVQYSRNQKILTLRELEEGYEHVKIAASELHRPLKDLPNYVQNLLARNWYQVKNAESIFAIGQLKGRHVDGGTGWAVQMAIDNNKPIFLFDQELNQWHEYDYANKAYVPYNQIPVPPEHFAGVGTRELTEAGTAAILEVYKNM